MLGAALALGQADPASAQEPPAATPAPPQVKAAPPPPPVADASSSLEEVVVTAQFFSQNLQTAPISITALDAAQLDSRSVKTILDVAAAAPNVNMVEGGGGFGSTNFAFIRGIGQPDFSFAFEPRVGFYVDDVYYSTTFGSIFDMTDIDRVEIERGPQGVLNGRNSGGRCHPHLQPAAEGR